MRSLRPDEGARLLACSVALLLALPLLAWLDAPVHRPQDEGLLLVYPELIIRGLLPHRDFLASYPPGNFFVLAAAYQLFEPSVGVERLVGFGYRVALILGLVLLGARCTGGSALIGGACGVIAALLLHPLRLEAFSWVGGLALLVWAVLALVNERRFSAGLLIGAALSFRLDLVFAAGLVVTGARFHSTDSCPLSRSSWFYAGLAIALVPLGVFLVVVVSPQLAAQDLLVGPVFETGPARRLPLESLGTNSSRLLLLVAIATGVALTGALRARNDEDRVFPFVVAALSIGLLPQALQRLDADHLLYAGCVSASLLPVAFTYCFQRSPSRGPVLFATALVIVATVAGPAGELLIGSIQHLLDPPVSVWINRDDRRLPARSQHELEAFSALGARLDAESTAGERVFIGPADLSRTNYGDLHLYHLFPDLIPASYFLEFNPESANRSGSRLAADLETAEWLLLSSEWDNWEESNGSSQPGDSRPNAVVRRSFHPVAQYGVWQLHRRK